MTDAIDLTLAALRAAVADETGGADDAARAQLARNPEGRAALVTGLRQDGSFDLLPVELQERLDPHPIHQTHHLAGQRIHTRTTVRLSGVSPDRLGRALVEEPWSWWKGGRISGFTRTPQGGTRFVLWPVWLRSPARVGIELSAPVAAVESGFGVSRPKVVVAARFFANFDGPGAYEILTVRGGSVLRSIWNGVTRGGVVSVMPVSSVTQIHLGAEAGMLSFPFPSGTGFPGLLAHLGARISP